MPDNQLISDMIPDNRFVSDIMLKRMKKYDFIPNPHPEGRTDEPGAHPHDPDQGFYPMKLPDTVYTAVWMIPLCVENAMLFSKEGIFEYLIPLAIGYLSAVTLQSSIVYFFARMVETEVSDLCVTGMTEIRVICLIIFNSVILIEFLETASMFVWIHQLPTWVKHDEFIKVDSNGRTNLSHQDYVNEKEYPGLKLAKPAHGITELYRVFIFTCLLPKIAVASVMLYYGTGHVLRSPNTQALILNTVGSIFIFDIDDYIYKVSSLTVAVHTTSCNIVYLPLSLLVY